jgi:hypothetical protein
VLSSGQHVATPAERLEARLADRGRQSGEEDPARRQHAPHLVHHRQPVGVVAREVQHRARDHDVQRRVRVRQRVDRLDAEPVRRDVGRDRRRQRARVRDRLGALVDAPHLEGAAQEGDEVAAPAAPGVEHAHPLHDPAAQQLVEQVDVEVPELRAQSIRESCHRSYPSPPCALQVSPSSDRRPY